MTRTPEQQNLVDHFGAVLTGRAEAGLKPAEGPVQLTDQDRAFLREMEALAGLHDDTGAS